MNAPFECKKCGHRGYGDASFHVCKDTERPKEFYGNEPPADLMEKLGQLQKDFPEGFVIFLPPQKENSTWIGVFRYNPKMRTLIEAIYQKIVGGQMMGGNQN